MDSGQCLGNLRAGSRIFLLTLVVLLAALSRRSEQLLRPIEVNLGQCERGFGLIKSSNPIVQKRDLVFEILHSVL